jgi:predicted DNA-binding antitoxin AbrB/MazE fold protein
LCYNSSMRSVEAKYEQGTLKLAQPLPLTPGERVRVIVVRQPDPKRWDLARLRQSDTSEDLRLAEAGLAEWDDAIDSEDEASG